MNLSTRLKHAQWALAKRTSIDLTKMTLTKRKARKKKEKGIKMQRTQIESTQPRYPKRVSISAAYAGALRRRT